MVKPEYVRCALQIAIGRGLKFPSIELEEFVATFLNGIKEVAPCAPNHLGTIDG